MAHLGEVVNQSLEELAGGSIVLGHGGQDLGAVLVDDLLFLTKITLVVVVDLDPVCEKRECSAGGSAILWTARLESSLSMCIGWCAL